MFRAPRDSFHADERPRYIDQLLSEESLKKTGYFDVQGVRHWLTHFRRLQRYSSTRAFIEASLVAVAGTQLWHHTFIDSSLADLPAAKIHERNGQASGRMAMRGLELGKPA